MGMKVSHREATWEAKDNSRTVVGGSTEGRVRPSSFALLDGKRGLGGDRLLRWDIFVNSKRGEAQRLGRPVGGEEEDIS